MTKYAVLDKDTIKSEIMPHLSVAKKGFIPKFDLVEIVNAILYKLKSGCQWRLLPMGHSSSRAVRFRAGTQSSIITANGVLMMNGRRYIPGFSAKGRRALICRFPILTGPILLHIVAVKRLSIREGRREARQMPSFYRQSGNTVGDVRTSVRQSCRPL